MEVMFWGRIKTVFVGRSNIKNLKLINLKHYA